MSMPDNLKLILEDIEMVGDQTGRQMYLIDYSDRFERVPESVAKQPYPESNHVKECESDAYVFPVPQADGTLHFEFDVLNPQGVSARAFAKIMKETADGQPLELIESIPDTIITDLFGSGISMGKGMGLRGILNMVKFFARQHYQS